MRNWHTSALRLRCRYEDPYVSAAVAADLAGSARPGHYPPSGTALGIQPDVRWQTNSNSPTWAAAADPGGYLNLYLPEFPPHLRRFGPDTPHTSSPILESLHLPLLARHPRDQSWLPMLASHWAPMKGTAFCTCKSTRQPAGRMVNRLPTVILPLPSQLSDRSRTRC